MTCHFYLYQLLKQLLLSVLDMSNVNFPENLMRLMHPSYFYRLGKEQ